VSRPAFRPAPDSDSPQLLEFMREYCAFNGQGFDEQKAWAALARLLRDPEGVEESAAELEVYRRLGFKELTRTFASSDCGGSGEDTGIKSGSACRFCYAFRACQN
jgi:hypothetical protein